MFQPFPTVVSGRISMPNKMAREQIWNHQVVTSLEPERDMLWTWNNILQMHVVSSHLRTLPLAVPPSKMLIPAPFLLELPTARKSRKSSWIRGCPVARASPAYGAYWAYWAYWSLRLRPTSSRKTVFPTSENRLQICWRQCQVPMAPYGPTSSMLSLNKIETVIAPVPQWLVLQPTSSSTMQYLQGQAPPIGLTTPISYYHIGHHGYPLSNLNRPISVADILVIG